MDKRGYYKNPAVAGLYEATRFSTPAGGLAHQIELAALRGAFRRDEKLLELACGTGRLLRALREERWTVSGVDQSSAMLAAGFPDKLVDVFVGDVFKLGFADESFDGAYSFRFTNHYADLRPFFSECARILRPGGRFVFDSMRWSPLLWDSTRWGGCNYPVSDRLVRQWLAETGFDVEAVRPLFPIGPYLLGNLPLACARTLLASKHVIPDGLQAIALWHARKKN